MKLTFKFWLDNLFRKRKTVKCGDCANYIQSWVNDEDCVANRELKQGSHYCGKFKGKGER